MYVKRLREFLNIWGFYGKMRTFENYRFQKILGKYEFFRLTFTARLPWPDRSRRISQRVANISTFFERSRRSVFSQAQAQKILLDKKYLNSEGESVARAL